MSEFPAPGDKPNPWLPEPGKPWLPLPHEPDATNPEASKPWLPDPDEPQQTNTGPNYLRGLFRGWFALTILWVFVVAFWYLKYGTDNGNTLFAHLVLYGLLPAVALGLVMLLALPVLRWIGRGFSSGA